MGPIAIWMLLFRSQFRNCSFHYLFLDSVLYGFILNLQSYFTYTGAQSLLAGLNSFFVLIFLRTYFVLLAEYNFQYSNLLVLVPRWCHFRKNNLQNVVCPEKTDQNSKGTRIKYMRRHQLWLVWGKKTLQWHKRASFNCLESCM